MNSAESPAPLTRHLSRAELLLEQSRPVDAEREARLALSFGPDNASALVLLGYSLWHQKRMPEALAVAEASVAAAPDLPDGHYLLANVHLDNGEPETALASSKEVLRLAPLNQAHITQRANIRLELHDFIGALEDCEAALRLDSNHVPALNLRILAFRGLGRHQEAIAAGEHALAQAPENPLSHAFHGLALMEEHEFDRAQKHLLDALRLLPGLKPARLGLLETLKARIPFYRIAFAYCSWLNRRGRWVLLSLHLGYVTALGLLFFGVRISQQSGLPLLLIVLILFAACYVSSLSRVIFNTILRSDNFGRMVLSREETTESNRFLIFFAAFCLAGMWWVKTGSETAAIWACIATLFSSNPGNDRLFGATR